MTVIFGHLNIGDLEETFVNTAGQSVVYDAVSQYLEQVNADMALALNTFVESATEDQAERYRFVAGGRMQKRGGLSPSGTRKATGYWDVAYPLEEFGEQIAESDVDMAYMTVGALERHVAGVIVSAQNTLRYELLKALFNNTSRTFIDERKGSLTVQPLANGDSVTYPPVLGAESAATENHYAETNYASSSISNTNNPIPGAVEDLAEHFGESTGGDNVVTFVNPTEAARLAALSSFIGVEDTYIRSGQDTDVPIGLPSVPGRIMGRMNGSWIVQWRWVPANYLLSLDLDAPAPLKMRVDNAATGLPRGLALVSTDESYPFVGAHWRFRFGIGVGNRLNGYVQELGTGGSYSIPTAYA